MSFWERLWGRKKKEERLFQAVLTEQAPLYSGGGQDIYLSDFVNNCIDRIASEVAKVELKSVVAREGMVQVQNDDLSRLFAAHPNPLQTAGDFLRNVEWLRRKRHNVFIYPQYQRMETAWGEFKRYTAFYPLNPSDFQLGTDENGRVWQVRLGFGDGSRWVFPYEELIHLKWRRGTNTLLGGGDDNGQVQDRDTLRTVRALDQTVQTIPKAIQGALGISGIYHVKSTVDADRLEKTRDDFEQHIVRSNSGIVALSLAGEFVPVNKQVPAIPGSLLNFLKAVIQEKYGVSAAVLSGNYGGEQNAAFFQTAIEDPLVELEQELTAKLFSPREIAYGHRVKGYYAKVNYLSTNDKMNLASLATNTGLMTLNEIAEMYGLSPFAGGNRRIMSLNYISADIADRYQLNQAGQPGAPALLPAVEGGETKDDGS